MVFDRTATGMGFLAAMGVGLALDAFLGGTGGSVLFILAILAFPVGILLVWSDARTQPGQDLRLVRVGGWSSVGYILVLVVLLVALTPFNLKRVGVINPDPSPVLEELAQGFFQLLPVVLAAGSIAVAQALLRRPLRLTLLVSLSLLVVLGLLDLTVGQPEATGLNASFLPRPLYGLIFLVISAALVMGMREMRHPADLTGTAPSVRPPAAPPQTR